ncbi:hypothetical protein BDY19DRAFT_901894 [Irpex rosettiformis]|uniref:Uncharacterized protein n=1 Tax=Irpex rosettiformis TaxID=378272 RepID=A0ACB8UKD1_9APHY|nr:hypothetical protein BDY19DRAFT_901894 [Irpex rosettiformis]
MTPPPIQLFLTTIASQITLRQRQEYILRILQVKKISFTSYDLASDEDAKKLWRRKAPRGELNQLQVIYLLICLYRSYVDKQQLPGILVGGEFAGTFEQFEEAVEFNELSTFLRLNEDYKPFIDEAPLLRAEPIGVPGAYSPLQMHPQHAVHSRSPSPSPLALREKEKKEVQVGDALAEFGLGDVSVSMEELKALVEELGLGGKEASELVSGLAGTEKNIEKSGGGTAPLKNSEGKVGERKAEEKPFVKDKEILADKGEVKKNEFPVGEVPQAREEAIKPSADNTEISGEPQQKEPIPGPGSPHITVSPPHKTLPIEPKATS